MSVSTIQRFGISMPDDLLAQFDEVIAAQGYANRSEAIRDIVRDHLVRREWDKPTGKVLGSIMIVYDHHTRGLESRLVDLQHSHLASIRCTTHVHLDHDNCVEVMVVEGDADEVRRLADQIISVRGVKHGQLTCTAIAPLAGTPHEHAHEHGHGHHHGQ